MNNLEVLENKHQLCKQLAINSICDLLVEYLDADIASLRETDHLDLPLSSYFDYLILPIIGENEVFNLNTFANQYFQEKCQFDNFKLSIDKMMVLEDVVELVILVKRINDEYLLKQSLFEVSISICVFSFRHMKELKRIQTELNDFNFSQLKSKTDHQKSSNLASKSDHKALVAKYKLRRESKLNLLNCINSLKI